MKEYEYGLMFILQVTIIKSTNTLPFTPQRSVLETRAILWLCIGMLPDTGNSMFNKYVHRNIANVHTKHRYNSTIVKSRR